MAMTELTKKTLHNEWARTEEIKRIFDIEPYDAVGGDRRYIIDKESAVEIGIAYAHGEEEAHYHIHYFKYDKLDHYLISRDTGNRYIDVHEFEELVDVLHKWFRKPTDDEQLGLF